MVYVPKLSGKKSELPLARYVCDFLRATIFASDPYVLAVAWLCFLVKVYGVYGLFQTNLENQRYVFRIQAKSSGEVSFFEVAFWQLQKEFEFVRVKNKFGEEGLRPELRTNILVNLWVKYLELILVVSVCSTL